jgi:hypothetical protein
MPLDAVFVPSQVDAAALVTLQPGAKALHRGGQRARTPESKDHLVDRPLGARRRTTALDRVHLRRELLVERADLRAPPIVGGVVVIAARLDHQFEPVITGEV